MDRTQLEAYRRDLCEEIARAGSHRYGTPWFTDRVREIEYCNRRLAMWAKDEAVEEPVIEEEVVDLFAITGLKPL